MIGAMSADEIETRLERQRVGRIGCATEDRPYMVPITYAYDGSCVYGYSALGRKIGVMRAQPQIYFPVDEIDSPSTWRSVIAEGVYEEIEDETARREALARLLRRDESPVPRVPNARSQIVFFRLRLTEKPGRFERSDTRGGEAGEGRLGSARLLRCPSDLDRRHGIRATVDASDAPVAAALDDPFAGGRSGGEDAPVAVVIVIAELTGAAIALAPALATRGRCSPWPSRPGRAKWSGERNQPQVTGAHRHAPVADPTIATEGGASCSSASSFPWTARSWRRRRCRWPRSWRDWPRRRST